MPAVKAQEAIMHDPRDERQRDRETLLEAIRLVCHIEPQEAPKGHESRMMAIHLASVLRMPESEIEDSIGCGPKEMRDAREFVGRGDEVVLETLARIERCRTALKHQKHTLNTAVKPVKKPREATARSGGRKLRPIPNLTETQERVIDVFCEEFKTTLERIRRINMRLGRNTESEALTIFLKDVGNMPDKSLSETVNKSPYALVKYRRQLLMQLRTHRDHPLRPKFLRICKKLGIKSTVIFG